MLNKFKEFQNPAMYKYFKLGFATLIVMAVLLFAIGLAVSPTLRHDIGIGNATPIEKEARPHRNPQKNKHPNGNEDHIRGKHSHSGHHSQAKAKEHKGAGNPVIHRHNPSESISQPQGGEHVVKPVHHEHHNETPQEAPHETPSVEQPSGSGNETPAPSNPTTPTHPTESGGGTTPPTVGKPPKTEVELNIPPVTNAPVVEEVVGTVNETVNGVTGTVEGTVNELGTPIHIEVPEVCLVTCH